MKYLIEAWAAPAVFFALVYLLHIHGAPLVAICVVGAAIWFGATYRKVRRDRLAREASWQ